jgi:hypothetical protein
LSHRIDPFLLRWGGRSGREQLSSVGRASLQQGLAWDPVEKLLAAMTPEQKIGQLN